MTTPDLDQRAILKNRKYDLPLSSYFYNGKTIVLDDEIKAISKAATSFIRKNKGRRRYDALHDVDMRCTYGRLAMLTPPSCGVGYLTFSDSKYWSFIQEVRNLITDANKDELQQPIIDTLLINYNKRHPMTPEIMRDPDYAVDKSYYDLNAMRVARQVVDGAMCWYWEHATPDLIKLHDKKTSSIGFPYEFADGTPIYMEDIYYGVNRPDYTNNSMTRFLKSYTEAKRSWRETGKGIKIFEDQMRFIELKMKITPSNIGTLIENNLISVHNNALRENCPDAPINTNHVFNLNDVVYTKDRNATYFGSDMEAHVGMIDVKRLNTIYNQILREPGASNRIRRIEPSNNVMHTNGTLIAKATVWGVEHGCKGHPSTRDVVIEDWKRFYDKFSSLGYNIYVTSGDCKNAEVTIASNDIFDELVPARFLDYLRLTSNSIMPYRDYFRFIPHAYCSAVWYTTWWHLIKGNFEKIRLDYYNLKCNGFSLYPLEKAVRNYLYCLWYNDTDVDLVPILGEDYDPETRSVRIGEQVYINPKLATDDMVGQIAVKGKLTLHEKTSLNAKSTNMSYEVGNVVAFGMYCTPADITENFGSRIAKTFTGERMGFSWADGFSTYVSIKDSPYRDIIDFCLNKHFGNGYIDYKVYESMFERFIDDYNVDAIDVFNEYSPTGKRALQKIEDFYNDYFLYGAAVQRGVNPNLTSARVPDEFVYRDMNIISKYMFKRKDDTKSFFTESKEG